MYTAAAMYNTARVYTTMLITCAALPVHTTPPVYTTTSACNAPLVYARTPASAGQVEGGRRRKYAADN
eukprot:3542400-Pyramimonas_sp.AAC.1